jgi:nucleoside-diphosphate-sugar epimerase
LGRVLVTGGRGFIGRRLVTRLEALGHEVGVLTRGRPSHPREVQGDLQDGASLARACAGIHTVFHCAGHAHAFSAMGEDEARRHHAVNALGTRAMAEAAAAAGVQRFVFLSSVKAMGEPGARCIDETCPLPPETDYGRAKRAGEVALHEVATRSAMHAVSLRLAMVYGAGGRGNLERMAALVRKGVFPPLPETSNRRSLVHGDDVIAAMMLVAQDPRAAGQTYVVAHPDTASGRQLYDALRAALGLPARRWAVPYGVLAGLARLGDGLEALLGRRLPLDSEALDKLLGSACYLPTRLQTELGWQPQMDLAAGLREMLGAE